MKNRTVLLYMTFVFLSNFSTILYFLTVYLEFVGLSMVAISGMMIAYQVSKFVLEVPTGYIADRFGRKTSGLVGVVGMLGYYAALLLVRSPLLLIGAFALKGFAVACVSGSIEAIYIESVSQDQLVRLNVIERFVFYASYAISACVGGFISSVGAYLIGLSADIIAMVLTLVVVACIPEIRRGDTAATPKRGMSTKMIGAAIVCSDILRSAFMMDCSQAFAFVALEDFFSLLLAGRGMNAVASGVTIAVQLLASASIGFIVPSAIAHVDKGCFARICGIVRLFLTALFLIPFTPVYLLPVFYVLQTVAYSLFAPIKYSIFQNAADSSMRCSLISVQSQMVAVGAILFYLFNAALNSIAGTRVILLVALGISSLVYIPALFRLTSQRT
ncbi:MFS transporter [Collinsella sp. OF02-10]|uniref:MFS transporter n=1 Tax=Collinsella sp. OF02-10 TaxID=2292324 RepID=UPI000E47EF36|nr:MFS transporter [Collinsella sp. OF02-10]RGY33612.1 MFS transporter [Collinsella sp. OF02-10]